MLKFGVSMFFTDYSMAPGELGQALESRGYESVWAPEHSHIPVSRKSPFPGGGDLPKKYYDCMDPFVTLTAAAMATKTLMVGTGISSPVISILTRMFWWIRNRSASMRAGSGHQ